MDSNHANRIQTRTAVTSFYKTVSDPIDPVTLYEVNDYINEGVSLMTFFGHASATGFDQNVDEPENWDSVERAATVEA